MKEKEFNKYMSQDVWYHATTLVGWDSLCKQKVKADYNYGQQLDFGTGFYMCPKQKQAIDYIKRAVPYLDGANERNQIPVIVEFELNMSKLPQEFKGKTFLHYDLDFAEFVFKNRLDPETKIHDYDYVFGVMSDSVPEMLMAKYTYNELTMEEVLIQLTKWTSMSQICLNSQQLCDILKVRRAYILDADFKEMEELNANDYNKN